MSRIKYTALGSSAPVKLADTPPPHKTLPEVGRISIGETVTPERGKSYPRSTDYFVIRSTYARLISDRYGEKPSELPVLFYSDELSEVCPERLEIRDQAGRLFGSGDGETFLIWNATAKRYQPYSQADHPDILQRTASHLGTQWVPTLTLRFAVKDVPVLGYWQFSTHGVATSIPNLRDRFDACLRDLGMIRFLPFMLTVKKVRSNKPGDSRQYPVVDLIPQLSIETGLRISQYVQDNPTFNPARLATYSADELSTLPTGEGDRLRLDGPTKL
ncbi:recombination directionality factor [Spirosoma sordidisoli]|uniref:Uncharacterized protein n=1 Tax=Spirosoma sordidisoli TaxID=2502893 RepID=A0A4Q2UBK5_9BACT|nr:hypothetical protein [Spirosoma sordidisoli]RYC66317.1 hypothetical protein EQG79_30035 [Spirosoma sordidisoli]